MVSNLTVKIGADVDGLQRELQKATGHLNSFNKIVGSVGGYLASAFAVERVASFTLEVSKLSGEAEAVRTAFERLPESTKLMDELKRATGGTVSELALMQRAVQANNFEISLKALPRLLEFATLRAQQTGQSVDYLVDSIITGIGRKSKLILDNLGISAVQLNEALGGASTAAASIGQVADAVGQIAEANLKNMASFSDNASTKLQKLEASWINVKVSIGDAANGTGILGKALDKITDNFDVLSSRSIPNYLKWLNIITLGAGTKELELLDKVQRKLQENAENKKQVQIVREVDRAYKEFNKDIDAYGRAISTHIYKTELLAEFTKRLAAETGGQIESYAQLKTQLDELNQQFEVETKRNDTEALKLIGKKIIAIKQQIEALDKLRNEEKKKDPLAGRFQFLPDLEAEASTNPDLRNEQAVVQAREFAAELNAVGTSAAFAGGQIIILGDTTEEVMTNIATEVQDLTPIISLALSGIGHAMGDAISGTQSFGDGLLSVLGGVLVQLGEMLITAGLGVEAFKKSLESLNGYVAIAAGIALIAVGSAISGSIRKLGSSAGSSHTSATGTTGSSGSGDLRHKAGQRIELVVSGELRGRGSELIAVLQNASMKDSRVKFGT